MVKEDDVSSSGLFLRPDGHLGGTGFDADDGTLCALYDRLETAIRAATEAAGGDFLAFVRSLGAGWRDVGKVTLHLAENKGDRSGTRGGPGDRERTQPLRRRHHHRAHGEVQMGRAHQAVRRQDLFSYGARAGEAAAGTPDGLLQSRDGTLPEAA